MNLEELGEVGTRGKLIIPVERTLPLPPYRYILYFWAAPGGGGLAGCRKWHRRGYCE